MLKALYFEKITGIYAENNQYRTALINLKNDLNKKSQDQVTWGTIKNAAPYLIREKDTIYNTPQKLDSGI
jgi:hypothetical protein